MKATHQTQEVLVGGVGIGGEHPVRIQSMTNTETSNAAETIKQVRALARAGSELIRLTVNTPEAAKAVPHIKEHLLKEGITNPLIGDFHFNGHLLLVDYPDCAAALDKYRINPGTIHGGKLRDRRFQKMIEAAIRHKKPVRIGVNWGSLDRGLLAELMDENAKSKEPKSDKVVLCDAMVKSVLESSLLAEHYGLPADRIIVSAKTSAIDDLIFVNREIARCSTYPIHLGLTEAGLGIKGVVVSTVALTLLLQEGIGNTIRVSLTPGPGGLRTDEVRVCQEVLQALGLRKFAPAISACPGCGRTTSTFFVELAAKVDGHIRKRMPTWKTQYPGVENLRIAVMGCVVNGPGESKHADIGISLPGTNEAPRAPVYVDGAHFATLSGPTIAEDFCAIIEKYIAANPAPLMTDDLNQRMRGMKGAG